MFDVRVLKYSALKETSTEASNKHLRRHTNAKDDSILITYGGGADR